MYTYYFTKDDYIELVSITKRAILKVLKVSSRSGIDELICECVQHRNDPDLNAMDIVRFEIPTESFFYDANIKNVYPSVDEIFINGRKFIRSSKVRLYHQAALVKYIVKTARRMQILDKTHSDFPYTGGIQLMVHKRTNYTYFSKKVLVPYQSFVWRERRYVVYFKMYDIDMQSTDYTIYILQYELNKTIRFYTAYEEEPSESPQYSINWMDESGDSVPVFSPERRIVSDRLESRTEINVLLCGIKTYKHMPVVVKHFGDEEKFYKLIPIERSAMDNGYDGYVETEWLKSIFQMDWAKKWLAPNQANLEDYEPFFNEKSKDSVKEMYFISKEGNYKQFFPDFLKYEEGDTFYINFEAYKKESLFFEPSGKSRLFVNGFDVSPISVNPNESLRLLFWRVASAVNGKSSWSWILENIKSVRISYLEEDQEFFHQMESNNTLISTITPFNTLFSSVENWLLANSYDLDDEFKVSVELTDKMPKTVECTMYVNIKNTETKQMKFDMPSTYYSTRVYEYEVYPKKRSNDLGPYENELEMALKLREFAKKFLGYDWFTEKKNTVFKELRRCAKEELKKYIEGDFLYDWKRGSYGKLLKKPIMEKYDKKSGKEVVAIGYLTVVASIVRKHVALYNMKNPNTEESTVFRMLRTLQTKWGLTNLLCDRVELTLGNNLPVMVYQSFDDMPGNAIHEEYILRSAFYKGGLMTQPKILKLYPGKLIVEVTLKIPDVRLLRNSRRYQLTFDFKSYNIGKNVVLYKDNEAIQRSSYRIAPDELIKCISRLEKLKQYMMRSNMPAMYDPQFEIKNGKILEKEREKEFVNVGLLGCIDVATKDYQDRMSKKRDSEGKSYETFTCSVCQESGANCYLSDCRVHYYHYTCLYDKIVRSVKSSQSGGQYQPDSNSEEVFLLVRKDSPLLPSGESVKAHADDLSKVSTVQELLQARLERNEMDWNFIESLMHPMARDMVMINTNIKCELCRFSICPKYTVISNSRDIVPMPKWDACENDKLSWVKNYSGTHFICKWSPFYGHDELQNAGAMEVVNHTAYWKAYSKRNGVFNVPKQINRYALSDGKRRVVLPDIMDLNTTLDMNTMRIFLRAIKIQCENTMKVIIQEIQEKKQKLLDDIKNEEQCWVFDIIGIPNVVKINTNATVKDLVKKLEQMNNRLIRRICNMTRGGKVINIDDKPLLEVIEPFGSIEERAVWPNPRTRIRLLCQRMPLQMQNDLQRIKLNICLAHKGLKRSCGYFLDVAKNEPVSNLLQLIDGIEFDFDKVRTLIYCERTKGVIQWNTFGGTWGEFITDVRIRRVPESRLEEAYAVGGEMGTLNFVDLCFEEIYLSEYMLKKYGDLSSPKWKRLSLNSYSNNNTAVEINYKGETFPCFIDMTDLGLYPASEELAKAIGKDVKAIVAEYKHEDGDHFESLGIWMSREYYFQYWMTPNGSGGFEEDVIFKRFETPLVFNEVVSRKDMYYAGIIIFRRDKLIVERFLKSLRKKHNYRLSEGIEDERGWKSPLELFGTEDILLDLILANTQEEKDKIAYEQISKNMFTFQKKVPDPSTFRIVLNAFEETKPVYGTTQIAIVNANETYNAFELLRAESGAKAIKQMSNSQESLSELKKKAIEYEWPTRLLLPNSLFHTLPLNEKLQDKSKWPLYFKTIAQNLILTCYAESRTDEMDRDVEFNIKDPFYVEDPKRPGMYYSDVEVVSVACINDTEFTFSYLGEKNPIVKNFFSRYLGREEGSIEVNSLKSKQIYIFVKGNFSFSGALNRTRELSETEDESIPSILDLFNKINF